MFDQFKLLDPQVYAIEQKQNFLDLNRKDTKNLISYHSYSIFFIYAIMSKSDLDCSGGDNIFRLGPIFKIYDRRRS